MSAAQKSDFDTLECPICGKPRKPFSVNKDGSVTYVCKVDWDWQDGVTDVERHASTYSWRINADGELEEVNRNAL